MDKEQLFNILEKLIDELEFYASIESTADPLDRDDTLQYCQEIRQKVFTDDSDLSFNVEN
jgi:hypothetical protein